MNKVSHKERALPVIRVIMLIGASLWILAAFHYYLPTLSPMRSLDIWLRRTGAYDVLLMLWFAGVAYCTGRHFLRLIGVTPAAGAEDAAFSIASGTMLFSWIVLILALVHGLYRPVAYALLLAPSLVWGHELGRLPGAVWRALVARIKSFSWTANSIGGAFIVVYLIAVLGVILISALAPSFEYDDLVYHLAASRNFVLAHKLVSLPDVPHAFFPKNVEMLHTLGMLLHNDIVSKLLVFLSGCVTMVGVYAFSVRFASRAIGIVAIAILAASPLFIWEMRTAHVDIGLTLFIFAGTYATVIWLRTRQASWFRLACFFLAFSLGIKYWAILALGITVSLVFFTVLLQSRRLRHAVGDAFKLGICSSLGLLPWGLINLYCTGNPVFPLLNGIFHSPYWTTTHTNMGLGEWFQGGIRITFANWWDFFRLSWEMMTDPQARFGGNIGPWYVIFTPILLFFPGLGVELGFLFIAGVLYFVGWAIAGPWARFVLPALPGMAAGAAFAIMRLLRTLRSFGRTVAVAGAILLCVLAILASPYFESKGSWSRYGYPPIFTLPIRYLSGKESKSEYLRRYYLEYRAVEYLNQIPGEKKVLYVHSLADGFYLNGKAAFHYSPYVPALAGADAEHIHAVLRQNGVTHIAVEQPFQETSALSSRESDFTHRYLRKLYQKNASIVYELLPSRIDQTVVSYDFMDHLDENAATRLKPGTPGSAYKAIRAIADDSRYTIVTAAPSKLEFHVRVPSHTTLSFAAGREDPGYTGKGSLQIWISTSDSDGQMLYSRDLEGNIQSWIENQVDLSEYAGQRVTITLRTENGQACNYFWADPVLMAPSSAVDSPELPETSDRQQEKKLTVLGGTATPATVKIGQEYEMSFSGKGLTPDLYFDIRFLAPNTRIEQIANNWQHGTILRHSVDSSISVGRWIITGVRAHSDPFYHEGPFNPVYIPMDVEGSGLR